MIILLSMFSALQILKKLLNCILKELVSNIVLNCNSIVKRELFDDKIGIFDIRAKIEIAKKLK